MKDSLGVIGGLGSEATIFFYQYVIKNTKVEKDQEHINMVILNHATIPDRTSYLLDHSKDCPLPYLIEDAKTLESIGCREIVIPCNTSFAFYKELTSQINIKVNNLIEDTCSHLVSSGVKKVLLLATTGTITTHIYQDYLTSHNIEYQIPDEEGQKKVMSIIYDDIKKGKDVDINKFMSLLDNISDDTYVILGCTELSILKEKFNLNERFIDPLYIEAIKVIKSYGKTVKEK